MLADDEDEDGGGFMLRPSFSTVLEVNPVIDVSLSFSLLLSCLYCRRVIYHSHVQVHLNLPNDRFRWGKGSANAPSLTALTCIEAALLYESFCSDNHENSQ